MNLLVDISEVKQNSFYRRSTPIIKDNKFGYIYYIEKIQRIDIKDYVDYIYTVSVYTSDIELVGKDSFPKVIVERFIDKEQMFNINLTDEQKAKAYLLL